MARDFDEYLYNTTFSSIPVQFYGPWEDTPAHRRALASLLAGVDQLYIESVFLSAEADHAQRKNHLTARQAGLIAREIGARYVVQFHFSPRYAGREAEIEAELRAAWSGAG